MSAVSASQVRRFGAFALVGASGIPVNAAVMWALHSVGVYYLVAMVVATQVAIAWNFVLSEGWVFRDRRHHTDMSSRMVRYFLVNNLDTLVRIPAAYVLVTGLGMRPSPVNLALVLTASAAKFLVVDRLVYRSSPTSAVAPSFAPAFTTGEPQPEGV